MLPEPSVARHDIRSSVLYVTLEAILRSDMKRDMRRATVARWRLRALGEETVITPTLHILYRGPPDMQLSRSNQPAVNLGPE